MTEQVVDQCGQVGARQIPRHLEAFVVGRLLVLRELVAPVELQRCDGLEVGGLLAPLLRGRVLVAVIVFALGGDAFIFLLFFKQLSPFQVEAIPVLRVLLVVACPTVQRQQLKLGRSQVFGLV